MAGKKESGTPWRQTSVVIRDDIFEMAHEQKIDISDAVNQALAERLGIDYRQQKIPEGNVPEPVFIAPNAPPSLPGHAPAKQGVTPATAIINADDPRAAKAVKSRNLPKESHAREVPAAPAPVPEKEAVPSLPIPSEKAKKPAPSRKKKEDSPKLFFTSTVLRDDAATASVIKDEMYYAFERWCRDHRILTIPDKKSFGVILKNQFAVKEKMVNGTPTWIGVKLKK